MYKDVGASAAEFLRSIEQCAKGGSTVSVSIGKLVVTTKTVVRDRRTGNRRRLPVVDGGGAS